tara:strand:+ start:1369 stop:2565 length:1197 start_codon:yes stop_codon:yes gene_type:complete
MDSLVSENNLYNKSFDFQLSSVCNHSIMYGDSFSRSMNSLGNEAFDFFSDFEVIQKQWAIENGVSFDQKSWKRDIIFAQISYYKADVVYFQDTENLKENSRKELKKRFPFLKIIALYSGYPSRLNQMDDIDLLFVGTPRLVEQYKAHGLNPFLLYHGFDENVISKLETSANGKKTYDFSFIGSSGYGYGLAHEARYWALKELKQKTDIDLWLEEKDESTRKSKSIKQISLIKYLKNNVLNPRILDSSKNNLFNKNKFEEGSGIPLIPLKNVFNNQCYSALFGLDMYKVLSKSKIVFNMHTDAAEGVVGNMRMFESTGMGTCLLTDTGSNMADLFLKNQEVVTYSTVSEAIEKVNYLLDHDEERKKIAFAGQKRTLKDHTIKIRCQEIDQYILDHLNNV